MRQKSFTVKEIFQSVSEKMGHMMVRIALITVHAKSTMFTAVISLMVLTSIAGNAHAAGMMLLSDNDYQQLAVNAYGGAKNGITLKLVDNCTAYNTDCTFTYHQGMLLSDTNPSLAIKANGRTYGSTLVLVNNCTPSNPDCLWTFDHGEWFSASSGLAVNAYNGARNDATLELVNNCTPDNADCTWLITYQIIYLE
jgi:hypothetical protein